MNLHFSQLKAILSKNLRLLLRSKSSSLAILLGPLLVILIVGVVFTSSGVDQANIGVVSEGFSDIQAYQDSLSEEFSIIAYEDRDTCIDSVKKARTSGCVVFTQEREALVYVDPTDTSLVYTLIDRVTGRLDAQSGEVRAGLAEQLLGAVEGTGNDLADDQQTLAEAVDTLREQERVAQQLADSFNRLRVDTSLVDKDDIEEAVEATFDARDRYKELSVLIREDYERIAREYDDNASINESEEYLLDIEAVDEGDAQDLFAELIDSIEDANQEISESQEQSDDLQEQTQSLSTQVRSVREDIESVQGRAQLRAEELNTLNITDEDITSPITTTIAPVSRDDDALGSIFPSFLTLLIMFTTMLLASQLVINERSSRAYFRNFTTPTPDWMFVLATYITTLAVVLVQLILLFIVVGIFAGISVLANFGVNLVLLFSIVTFFSFLGMLIGYLFTTQEGVMLSSITISSLFLLVSGLVLPIQTLPGIIRFFVRANPFVIGSELLTGSIIFGFGVGDLFSWWIVLVLYALMLYAVIMILQRVARVKYFESSKTANRISTFLGESEIPQGKELHVGEYLVNSKESLLAALISISDEEYEQYADHQRNIFAEWVRDVYKDDRLARLLRNTSRQGAITVLKNELQ